MDQATTLRHLLGNRVTPIQPVLGDTACPLPSLLAGQLVDLAADAGEGGLVIDGSRDVLVEHRGLKKRYDLHHYLAGDVSADAVVLPWGPRRAVLPASRALVELGGAQSVNRQRLASLLAHYTHADDAVYLTLPFTQWTVAADVAHTQGAWLWLVQPSSLSVTECYKAMRHAVTRCGNIGHRVWVSRARSADQADEVFAELERATRRFMAQPLDYLGQYTGFQSARAYLARNRLEALI